MQVNDIAQDMGDTIHHPDVAPDRDVAMIRRRRGQLAREIAGNRVFALAEVRIERSAGLKTRFLIGRQPIPGSEANRRPALMLTVPVLRGLTRVVVELHRPLTIPTRPTIGRSSLCLDGPRRRDQSQRARCRTES
jgi:hypothetical protein